MIENLIFRLQDAEITKRAGASLVHSLYAFPVTIWLTGELGAGKTTFLSGFAKALGIPGHLTSPTYTLEQRYQTASHGELIHIDLFRLAKEDALALLSSSEGFQGIRCVEWAERLPKHARKNGISVSLADLPEADGRDLKIEFHDLEIPGEPLIAEWREEFLVPSLIQRHCNVVASIARRLGKALTEKGTIVRIKALTAAGKIHDLLRFIDFRKGAAHIEEKTNEERAKLWQEVSAKYAGLGHEAACAKFLLERGFPHIGEIVSVHGATLSHAKRATIEQKILYYADKRVKLDEVVSLEERFSDFLARYGDHAKSNSWYEEARRTEKELFPEGPPL